jgi:hypothetical protein
MSNLQPDTLWSDYKPHLVADDLRGKAHSVTLERIEALPHYSRKHLKRMPMPCAFFKGKQKYLILTPTNQDTLRGLFGAKVSDAIGKCVVIKTVEVKVGDSLENPIRIFPTPTNGEAGK